MPGQQEKKLIQNFGKHNVFVSNQQGFLGFFFNHYWFVLQKSRSTKDGFNQANIHLCYFNPQ